MLIWRNIRGFVIANYDIMELNICALVIAKPVSSSFGSTIVTEEIVTFVFREMGSYGILYVSSLRVE